MATNTADSSTEHTGNGSTTSFSISFTYLSTAEIDVKVNNVVKSIGSDYTISGQTLTFGSAPTNGHVISIKRDTNIGQKKVDFEDGSVLTETDLDNNTNQLLFGIQEIADDYVKRDGTQTITGDIVFEGSVDDANETTLSITNPTADRTITVPDVTGTIVTTGDTGTVTSTMIADGTIVDADINNSANIAGTKLADDSVTLAKLGSGALPTDITVASANIVDGTIVNGDIANTTITGGKLANDTVTATQIAANAVTASELADDAVDTNAIQDGGVTRAKIAADAIDGTKIENDAIANEHIANLAVGNAQLANGSVGATKLQTGAVTNSKLGDNSINAAKLSTAAVTTAKIQNGSVTGAKLAQNSVGNNALNTNAVATENIQNNAVTAAKIADEAIVTSSEQASATVDNATFFTTAAAEARYFNASTGETIKDGQTFPDNDTTIATTAAINDRIIDLVDDVGGFVPIANETSFPTANPDVNNGTGTIVSVATASTNLTPSGTTVTIANGAGSGNTVTITGVPSVISSGFGFLVETTTTLHTYTFHRLTPKATEVTTVAGKAVEIGRLGTADAVADMAILGTTDVVADMNMLATTDIVADMALLATTDVIADMALLAVSDVISDMNDLATSGNITAMSTCSTNIASINNASSNISSVNNFGDKYQVASSDPSTDGGGNALAAGDLYFNTSANELKVYTGSQWQGGVTATGNFATVTGNTFTGNNIYNDNVKALFGTSSDLEIFHDNSAGATKIINTTTNPLIIQNTSDLVKITGNNRVEIFDNLIRLRTRDASETYLVATQNGSVDLYYDNAKKFELNSVGTLITGTSKVNAHAALNGNTDYNGQNFSFLVSYVGGNNTNDEGNGICFAQQYASSDANSTVRTGAIIGYKSVGNGAFGGGLQFKVQQSGANPLKVALKMDHQGTVYMPHDNQFLKIGASQDLKLYHDSNNSIIENSTGITYIKGTGGSGNTIWLQPQNNESSAKFNPNGDVELFYDNSLKFATTSTGVDVTGNLIADCTTAIDPDANLNSFMTGGIQDGSGWGVNGIAFGAGTGHMAAMGSNNANLYMAYGDGSNANSLTTYQTVTPAGAVELYYNGSKKFETTSSGASVTGNLAVSSALTVSGGLVNANGGLQIENTDPRINLIDTNGNPDYHIRNNGGALTIRNTTNGVNNFVINGAGEITTGSNFYVGNNLSVTGTISTGSGSNQLNITHSGGGASHVAATGDLVLKGTDNVYISGVNNETHIKCTEDNRVELYYDNQLRLVTTSNGIQPYGDVRHTDNIKATFGTSQDLEIYHDGGHSRIKDVGTGDLVVHSDAISFMNAADTEQLARFHQDGSCQLRFDNSTKFETVTGGANVTGALGVNTTSPASTIDARADSNATVTARNTGTVASIAISVGTSTNQLVSRGVNSSTARDMIFMQGTTTTTRLDSNGHFRPETNNTYDLGTTSYRWRNVYTNDLNLSNEGGSNDVDGTWGSYTIQEGAEDLFLINKRSGKKYKFALTEVS